MAFHWASGCRTRRPALGPNPRTFGHSRGSLGYADPGARTGFGCIMNQRQNSLWVDPRPQRLIDTTARRFKTRRVSPQNALGNHPRSKHDNFQYACVSVVRQLMCGCYSHLVAGEHRLKVVQRQPEGQGFVDAKEYNERRKSPAALRPECAKSRS